MNADAVGIVLGELGSAGDEVVGGVDGLVLDVPTERALVGIEPRTPFAEHLAHPVRLPADGIMSQHESQREDASVRELRVVPAAGCQIHGFGSLLPALDLQSVPLIAPLVHPDHRSRVGARYERIISGTKIE